MSDFATLDSDLALSSDDLDLVLGGDAPEPGTHEDNPNNGAPPVLPSTPSPAAPPPSIEVYAPPTPGALEAVYDVVKEVVDGVYNITDVLCEGGTILITAIGDRVESFFGGDGGTAH